MGYSNASDAPRTAVSRALCSASSCSAASARHIRCRYLSSLGISPPSNSNPIKRKILRASVNTNRDSLQLPRSIGSPSRSTSDEPELHSCLRRRRPRCTKDNSNCSSNCVSDRTARPCCDLKTKVSFTSEPDQIHAIPSRDSMSSRRRRRLWIASDEMRRSYTRNMKEFRSENFDYRQCLEEDSFIRTDKGQLVHPVHLIDLKRRKQFHYNGHGMHSLSRSRNYHAGSPPKSCASTVPASHYVTTTNKATPTAPLVAPNNLKQHFCRVMSAQQQRW